MKQTIKSLQGLRAIAFLSIFLFHCGIIETGPWGVSIFLILSGFLMVYSYYDKVSHRYNLKESLNFSFNKLKKLYPLHIAMMFIALLPSLRHIENSNELILLMKRVFTNIFLIQAWIPSNLFWYSLNGVAWFLSVMVFIYTVFPQFLYLLRKLNYKKSLLIGLIIYLLQCTISIIIDERLRIDIVKYITYIFPIYRLGDFMIGCCMGYYYLNKKINTSHQQYISFIKELLVIILSIISIIIYTNKVGTLGKEVFRYNVLFTPSTVLLVYIFSLEKSIFSKLFSIKPLCLLADISSSCFLTHQIIIGYVNLLIAKFLIDLNSFFRIFLAFLITIGFSKSIKILKKIKH